MLVASKCTKNQRMLKTDCFYFHISAANELLLRRHQSNVFLTHATERSISKFKFENILTFNSEKINDVKNVKTMKVLSNVVRQVGYLSLHCLRKQVLD